MVPLSLRLVEGLRASVLCRDIGCRIPGLPVHRIPFTAYLIALFRCLGNPSLGKQHFFPRGNGLFVARFIAGFCACRLNREESVA